MDGSPGRESDAPLAAVMHRIPSDTPKPFPPFLFNLFSEFLDHRPRFLDLRWLGIESQLSNWLSGAE